MAVMTNQATGDGISVEMAEIKVSTRLTDRLIAYGLGACIGLCVYDPVLRIAGLAHIVLPARQPSPGPAKPSNMFAGKFADTAVPKLVEEVVRSGGKKSNLVAAVAGGAHIFSALGGSTSAPSRLEIGARNVLAVTEALEREGIRLIAQDVGGSHGRTVTLKACDGTVYIRPIGSDEVLLTNLGKAGS